MRQTGQEKQTDAKLFLILSKADRSLQEVRVDIISLEGTIQRHVREELLDLLSVVVLVDGHSKLEAGEEALLVFLELVKARIYRDLGTLVAEGSVAQRKLGQSLDGKHEHV